MRVTLSWLREFAPDIDGDPVALGDTLSALGLAVEEMILTGEVVPGVVLARVLDDLPPMGRKFTRYFDTTPMSHHDITRHGLWHKAVASYLACATFTPQPLATPVRASAPNRTQ